MNTTVGHRWVVTASAFSLIGCGITFDEPLSPVGASVDQRLQGEWLVIGDDEPSNVSISVSTEYAIYTESDGVSQTVTYASTRIDDHDFISYAVPSDDGDTWRWLILKYKCVSNDEIHLFHMEDEKVAEAIRTGGLSGEFKRVKPPLLLALLGAKSYEEITKMTTSRDKLQAFLRASPEKCFDMSEASVKLKRKQQPKAKSEPSHAPECGSRGFSRGQSSRRIR